MSKPDLLRRREALAALGALGLAAAIPKLRSIATPGDAEAASCILMPELTEGPYWVRNTLTRRDITESRPGIPLALTFKVQDASTCTPVTGADVELWHADARGVYSGGDVHTSQIFFPDAVSARVYRTKYYAAHSQADVTNAEDSIYRDGGERTKLRLRRRIGGGYRATLALGVS